MNDEDNLSLRTALSLVGTTAIAAASLLSPVFALVAGMVIGPTLFFADNKIGALASEKKIKRINMLLKHLSKELDLVKESIPREGFFVTDEGYDLINKVLEETVKTRHEEKIKAYARIIAGAAIEDEKIHDIFDEEYMVDIIAKLRDADLKEFSILDRADFQYVEVRYTEDEIINRAPIIANFISLGLLMEPIITIVDGGSVNDMNANPPSRKYERTKMWFSIRKLLES